MFSFKVYFYFRMKVFLKEMKCELDGQKLDIIRERE